MKSWLKAIMAVTMIFSFSFGLTWLMMLYPQQFHFIFLGLVFIVLVFVFRQTFR